MDDIDYWRLCDDLSIIQASLLIIGENPSEDHNYENSNSNKKPLGYDAAKTAIVNALKRDVIDGQICWESETDFNGNEVGNARYVDVYSSIVSVDSLRAFLKKRGIRGGFFLPNEFEDRNYLDPTNEFYAPKLAAAVKAWEQVSSNAGLTAGKTPKQAIEKWLREHASEYDLTDTEGNPFKAAIEQISKVANWKPSGGAAKTPTSTQVKDNPTPPEKIDENQIDDPCEDSSIPF